MEITRFEVCLQAELEELKVSLAMVSDSAATVMLDQSSVGRLSRMDAMQQQAMAVSYRSRLSMRQKQLEAALVRIHTGKFGKCCRCNEQLEPERLEVDPAVVFCTDCAEDRCSG